MFRFRKQSAADISHALKAARRAGDVDRRFLSLRAGLTARHLPLAFAHDRHRSRLGNRASVFAVARQAFVDWSEFDLGWVRVANPETPIATGRIVAVEVHAFGLRSLHLSRILETVDTATQFGFLYATTSHHGEEGEERFLLEFDPVDGGIWYELEAVSRPRHPLARLAYPITRALQHRFARDSHRRMMEAVQAGMSNPSH